MKRIQRTPVALDVRLLLAKEGRACISTAEARRAWKNFRAASRSGPILTALELMAGPRKRCFYCRDSRAGDVEHFKPIDLYLSLTFDWRNLFLVCAECNRAKSAQFPLAPDGQPLLLDVTLDDPWRHLSLESDTGYLAPQYAPDGTADPRGEAVLSVLAPLNDEAVVKGRRRAVRALRSAMLQTTPADPLSWKRLVEAVRQDDYGLAAWFASADGAGDAGVAHLRTQSPNLWRRFVGLATAT